MPGTFINGGAGGITCLAFSLAINGQTGGVGANSALGSDGSNAIFSIFSGGAVWSPFAGVQGSPAGEAKAATVLSASTSGTLRSQRMSRRQSRPVTVAPGATAVLAELVEPVVLAAEPDLPS